MMGWAFSKAWSEIGVRSLFIFRQNIYFHSVMSVKVHIATFPHAKFIITDTDLHLIFPAQFGVYCSSQKDYDYFHINFDALYDSLSFH